MGTLDRCPFCKTFNSMRLVSKRRIDVTETDEGTSVVTNKLEYKCRKCGKSKFIIAKKSMGLTHVIVK